MHPYDIMLVISIATAAIFTSLIYVRRDLVLAFGSIAAAIIGSFGGAFVALRWAPVHDQFAIMFGAIGGSALLIGVFWVLAGRRDR